MTRWIRRPTGALVVVTIGLLVNQLAVSIYVTAVHGGDPGFIARHLPTGWFELWTPHWLVQLAHRWPEPQLLSPSVLVVPALLELPLVIAAYLLVARWLDDSAYRRLSSPLLLWVASLVWTTTFCLVEIDLWNPRTPADLALRLIAGVVTPLWLGSRIGGTPPAPRPPTAVGLLTFGGSAAALGFLVLVLYDTVLLYNLGRVPDALPAASAALVVLVGLRAAATRPEPPDQASAPGVVALLGASLRHFVVLLFVPALAVRYAMSYFGVVAVSAAVLLALAAAAAGLAVRGIVREGGAQQVAPLLAVATAIALVGGLVAVCVALATTAAHVEAALGLGAVLGFVTMVGLADLTDRLTRSRRCRARP